MSSSSWEEGLICSIYVSGLVEVPVVRKDLFIPTEVIYTIPNKGQSQGITNEKNVFLKSSSSCGYIQGLTSSLSSWPCCIKWFQWENQCNHIFYAMIEFSVQKIREENDIDLLRFDHEKRLHSSVRSGRLIFNKCIVVVMLIRFVAGSLSCHSRG